MASEPVVAGLRCSQVLAMLIDYVEGDLGPEERARLEAHVAGCDGCTRFGGRYASVIAALRQGAGEPPNDVQERLLLRLG